MGQRMYAHGARYPPSSRSSPGYVAAVTDMSTAASLIGTQKIGTQDHSIGFRGECLLVGGQPVRKRVRLAEVGVDGIRRPFTKGRNDNPGNRPRVGWLSSSYLHW